MLPKSSPGLALTDDGSGPDVVLVHGQPGAGRDWAAVVERLDGRVRVIVPDRPGYGETGGRAVGIGANTDALVTVLDSLGVEEVVVGGHSWGGAVALDLAQRHPGRVRGLVLVGSVGGARSIDDLDRLLALPFLGPLMALAGLSVLRAPRLRRLVAVRAAPTAPEVIEALAVHLFDDWRSFVIEQRALLAELPAIAARLGEVDVPAVVVMGETDRVVRRESQEALAAALPQGRLVRLPGVGHLVPHEAPAAVADAVLAAAAGTL
jgi:pimeloyl-ACP methyl ester carboxylesterase